MSVSTITHVSLNCPHCGATNQLNSDSGTDGLHIHCSKCHQPIGKLKELAANRQREAGRL